MHNVIEGGLFYGPVVQAGSVHFSVNRARRWTDDLARLVRQQEQNEWRRLLGDDTERIDLTYTRMASAGRAADHAGDTGRLLADGVHAYYTALSPRRLVITGSAGAGKTMLALELLLALIEHRGEEDPVPVRMQLADWDPRVPLADRFVEHLHHTYDWPRRKGRWLVERNLVLPVLDGLDEMDQPLASGRPDPAAARARAALEALNRHQTGRAPGALILTCRDDAYRALSQGPGPDDQRRLFDTAHIRVDPVLPAQAHAYLSRRAVDHARWRPLLDHLAAHPGSPIARLLSTPWRLCLVATDYRTDGDPAELIHRRTAKRLDRLLLARYIPATIGLEKPPRYEAAAVHRWLHVFARHVESADDGSPRAVLEPTELWRLPGAAAIRSTRMIATVLGFMFLPWLTFVLPFDEETSALAVQALLAAPFGLMHASKELPIDVRPRTLRHLAPWRRPLRFLAAIALAAAVALTVDQLLDARWGLVAAVGILIPVALLNRFTPTDAVLKPRQVLRDEFVATGVVGLIIGVGLVAGMSHYHSVSDAVLIAGPTTVYLYLTTYGGAGLRYLAFLQRTRGTLPLRVVAFLDWATAAGLLRLTGSAYQFRHGELQKWLATHAEPPTGSASR
ncbi:NACHT domain-containing protein [Streptomyces sp. NPDC051636]|uniref:NACHT domain-containing protein n=1 Tax=Streptomyces sp. NPDC051636 TaxID=3365663 RepID=UPI0037AD7121